MPTKKLSILIIDDDPFLLSMYGRKFLDHGCIVHGAQRAAEGLADAKRLRPDMIVLDVMLPDEDGLSLLKKLKRTKETASLKVCLLTNVAEPAYREQALILGAAAYLVKAYYDPGEVVEQVLSFLNSKKK